jgi:transposase
MEGLAQAKISVCQHMLAAAAGLGTTRHLAENLAHLSRRTGREGAIELGRDLCRRHVFPGKKGGACVGKTKRGKGTKLMVVADGKGVPLGVQLASASPNEVTLIEPTLETVAVPRSGRGRPRKNPKRLIYDKAADSDPLRTRLKKRGIDLICPHRINRTKPKRQDGRKLRRYKRRWKIERSIAWIANFRRLVVRYEREITMFYAFVHVACLLIAVRQF